MAIAAPTAGNRIVTTDLAAFYNLLKGVTGSGETVTLIYNAAGAISFQPSSDPATGTELFQIKNNAGTVQLALSSDGKVYAADGTAPLPGVTWEQDKDTGVYRITANTLGFAAGGTEKMRVDATGVSLDGGTTYLGRETNLWHWRYQGGLTPVEVSVTGTGGVALNSPGSYRRFTTGATSGSTAGVRELIRNTSNFSAGKIRRLEFTMDFVNIDANTSAYMLITTESSAVSPTLTANHIGVKNVAGVVSFTTADGATEQTTDITASITATKDTCYVTLFDGTTATLYVDGTLRATHATNVPVSTMNAALVWRTYITNSTAASKTLDLFNIDLAVATS